MKNKYSNFLIIIIPFVALIAGCKKDEDMQAQNIFISKSTSGNIEHYYYYDSDYKLTSIQRKYISSGDVDLEIQYSDYNKNNIPLRADYIKHLGPSGPIYNIYELDHFSRVKEYKSYDQFDRLQYKVQFYYFFNKIESIETLFPSNFKIKIVYTFNEKGNLVKLERVTNDTVISQSNSYLEYDDQKNWQSLLPPTALFNEVHSVNNATKIQSKSTRSEIVANSSVNMEYNADGYPIRLVTISEGDTTGSEVLYQYITK